MLFKIQDIMNPILRLSKLFNIVYESYFSICLRRLEQNAVFRPGCCEHCKLDSVFSVCCQIDYMLDS